ncbi:MAG: Crp/Fnr family transcriptional regulator [Sediminicola sp.]
MDTTFKGNHYLWTMGELSDFLQQHGRLTSRDIQLIESKVEEISVPKNTKLAEASHFVHELWFIKKGITRVYYYTDKGQEVTKYFIEERHFSSDSNSFLYQLPMTSYVETVIPCELIRISRTAFEDFAENIPGWNELILTIANRAIREKVNRISPMLAETGEERYLRFMERFPTMLNRIPLRMLASYLGVTKYSLSRIRKNMSH